MLLRHDLKDLLVPFKDSNKIKTNYSEVFQDIFVLQCLNGEKEGTYLEIGAAGPISGNNTYLLEKEFGWSGLSIDYGWDDWDDSVVITCDNQSFSKSGFKKYWLRKWYDKRLQPLLLTNAVTCDWWDIIHGNLIAYNNIIDYLQVDIDPPENTYKCLERLPFDKIDFKVITYEHDAYAGSDEWRIKSRKFLESKGYVLIAGNISKEYGYPFEDWWVNLKYINEMNSSITRNIFEESLPVMKYMFNK
tara:strand:+ start:1377 stop:2114 length:738 start_codon:yes stop_codon:yes gene_type:complete